MLLLRLLVFRIIVSLVHIRKCLVSFQWCLTIHLVVPRFKNLTWKSWGMSFLSHTLFICINIPAIALNFMINIWVSMVLWLWCLFKRAQSTFSNSFLPIISITSDPESTLRLVIPGKCSLSLILLYLNMMVKTIFHALELPVNLSFWWFLGWNNHGLTKLRAWGLGIGSI